MKLIMENFRSFREGREAYEKYVDMVSQDKENTRRKGDEDAAQNAEDDAEIEEMLAEAHEIILNQLKGLAGYKGEVSDYIKTEMEDEELSSESKVENFLEAVKDVGGIEKAIAHIKEKNLKGADKHLPKLAELHKQLSGGGEKGEEQKIEKDGVYDYTSKKGNQSVVQAVGKSAKEDEVIVAPIDPDSCDLEKPPGKGQFSTKKTNLGDPNDKCDGEAGGDSKIAKIIAKKLEQTGLDDYIKKITKRNDLFELEKVILNLALDSESPIKAQDLLKVVIDLKKDIEGKMQAGKKG
jgi:hypothetical protein